MDFTLAISSSVRTQSVGSMSNGDPIATPRCLHKIPLNKKRMLNVHRNGSTRTPFTGRPKERCFYVSQPSMKSMDSI